MDLLDRGHRLLATARNASAGRAAANLVPGAGQALTQTLLVLTADAVLADHTAPGPATLQVLHGCGVLTVDGRVQCRVEAGQWLRIPASRHGLRAATDLICLLTVATAPGDDLRDTTT